jgi:hypothetical protein
VSIASVSETRPYTPALQVFSGFDELLERPRQPIELPDDEHVALAQHVAQKARQLRPIGASAGGLLDHDPFAARLAQLLAIVLALALYMIISFILYLT